jgi:hypothetical protein
MTLETTLFDRLLALHGTSIKRMLTVQYRMHEKIMQFPSAELCVYSLRDLQCPMILTLARRVET